MSTADYFAYFSARYSDPLFYLWKARLWEWGGCPRRDPTDEVILSNSEMHYRGANGTPFCFGTEAERRVIGRLDLYYLRRMPWRAWREGSMRCCAKRFKNAEIVSERKEIHQE